MKEIQIRCPCCDSIFKMEMHISQINAGMVTNIVKVGDIIPKEKVGLGE